MLEYQVPVSTCYLPQHETRQKRSHFAAKVCKEAGVAEPVTYFLTCSFLAYGTSNYQTHIHGTPVLRSRVQGIQQYVPKEESHDDSPGKKGSLAVA
jgi:hypothetical protein